MAIFLIESRGKFPIQDTVHEVNAANYSISQQNEVGKVFV